MNDIMAYSISPEQWRPHSEAAHLVCFGTHKPAERDRIDFVIMAQRNNDLLSYVTCREHDSETLYWQFGGAFPGTRGSSVTFKAYRQMASLAKEKYARIVTLIENDNVTMIKMAMKIGFRAIGIRNFNGKILIEHILTEVL